MAYSIFLLQGFYISIHACLMRATNNNNIFVFTAVPVKSKKLCIRCFTESKQGRDYEGQIFGPL